MINNLKNKIRQLAREGLFHIFGSSVLAKVGGIVSSVVVIRHLPKATYGSFVDADNLYAYMAIFIGLGLVTAILQFCSEKIPEDRKLSIYRASLRNGMLGNIGLALLILILANFKYQSGATDVALFLGLMCLLPFFTYLSQFFQIVLRVRLNNQAFSQTNMIYTAAHVGGNIVFTLLWGVPGLIFSQYLGHALGAAYAAWELNKEHFFADLAACTTRLRPREQREHLSYGLVCTFSDFASTILVLVDVTCLGLVLKNSEVLADYRVASTIPSSLHFVPRGLTAFFYPKLVQAFSEGKRKGMSTVKELSKMCLVINGAIYLCLALFAPLIIWILFGKQYMNVIPVFQVMSINYLVYCVRNITVNVNAVLKKVKANLVFSVISGVMSIGLNLLLIPTLGSMGSAISNLSITVFIVILNILYLWRYLRKLPDDPTQTA